MTFGMIQSLEKKFTGIMQFVNVGVNENMKGLQNSVSRNLRSYDSFP